MDCMTNDLNKIKQPAASRFTPYLEKHRIFELFFDLGTMLAINKPKDHILFLRNVLIHMNDMRDRSKLILIAPPYFDKKKFAQQLAKRTGQTVISRVDFVEDPEDMVNPYEVANKLFVFIVENDILKTGWILHDYPSNVEEAKVMLLQGIIPSHTFVIVPSTRTSAPRELWVRGLEEKTAEELKSMWEDYHSTSLDLRYVFKTTLQEINVQSKTLDNLLNGTFDELQEFSYKGPLLVQRIVLIGPRGSRRGAIAKMVSEHLNIVLVDMVELVEQARISENELGDQIRFLDKKKVPIYASIILKLLQDKLLTEECMKKGWILLRFPRDRADLEALNSFDTPPNRIIFLGVNTKDCFNYLKEKRINKYHGAPDTLTNIKLRNDYSEKNDYFVHPTDEEKRVFLEHENYTSALQGMLDYCGKNCTIVNAEGSVEEIAERVEGVVGKAMPIYKSKDDQSWKRPELEKKICTEISSETPPSPSDLRLEHDFKASSKIYLAKDIIKYSRVDKRDCRLKVASHHEQIVE